MPVVAEAFLQQFPESAFELGHSLPRQASVGLDQFGDEESCGQHLFFHGVVVVLLLLLLL